MRYANIWTRDQEALRLRAAWTYDPETDPSLTVQADKDSADINILVKRFGITGLMPQHTRTPLNEEFIDAIDYRTALEQIRAADAAFMELPADVRSEFGNDPSKYLEAFTDPSQLDKLKRLKLIEVRDEQFESGGKSGESSVSDAGASGKGG